MSPPENPRRRRRPLAVTLTALVAAVLVGAAGLSLMLRHVPGRTQLQRFKSFVAAAQAAHPGALWHIVHDVCVTDKSSLGNPAPCLEVDLAKGYAVIKDPERATQILLVPTARITGIESGALLGPHAANYWSDAWAARQWLERSFGGPIPPDDVGLAVNSRLSRTQDQLHIHIDCVRPEAKALVQTIQNGLGRHWTRLRPKLFGRSYDARWIGGEDLDRSDPFSLLAQDPRARANMGSYAMALIGAQGPHGKPGFVLFRRRETLEDYGAPSAERLLDHRCHILKPTPGAVTPSRQASPAR